MVAFSYSLTDESGTVVTADGTDEPLTYVHGYEQLLPGIERALVGLRVGDKRQVTLAPEDAFGARDEAAMAEIARDELPPDAKPGDEYVMDEFGEDGPILRVVMLTEKMAVVDTNHPLAGKRLRADVAVHGVRQATPTEIEEAAADLEHDHEHDGSCGCASEEPEDEGDGLVAPVQLRRK